MAVHSALAGITRIQELALEESEARKLSEAAKNVIKHYPIGISDKQIAWVNLGITAFGIYGTRIAAYNVRMGAERRARTVTVPPAASGSPAAASGAAAAAPQPKPNGPQSIRLDSLTPDFMTAPPENEIVP